jgi:hypothetical protein
VATLEYPIESAHNLDPYVQGASVNAYFDQTDEQSVSRRCRWLPGSPRIYQLSLVPGSYRGVVIAVTEPGTA